MISGGSALQGGNTGTTLRIRDGKRQVHDGPYADSKEQLGGYMMFDVDDLVYWITIESNYPRLAYKGASLVRMWSADFVHRKGLGFSL